MVGTSLASTGCYKVYTLRNVSIIKNKLKYKFIIPVLVGLIGFLLVVGGSTLNFQNIGWLSKGDALFNYVGWELFRHSPWTNPIGLNPSYGLEFSSSIVYSDSIPILAIFFKIFSKWLGEPFQYFGLWLLLCFVMQAFFGYKLSELISKNIWIQLSITIIFLFTPVMFFRTNVHLALAGQFVILWAIYLNLKSGVSYWHWAFLVVIVLGIHFYLFVMVIALWFGSLLDRKLSTEKLSLNYCVLESGLIIFITCLALWQYGYLAITVGSSSGIGYGYYQFNLLGFFNSMDWSILLSRNIYNPPHFESFSYAGAGVLCSLILGVVQLGHRKVRSVLFSKLQQHQFMLIAIVLMLFVSISQNIYAGNLYFNLPINEKILFALNALGASSRFSWPFLYFVIFVSFWIIINKFQKGLVSIFFILFVLQVIDVSKGWVKLHNYFYNLRSQHITHTLTHDFWTEVPKLYTELKLVPPQHWPDRWNNFASYAVQNKMATNAVFLARHDALKVIQAKDVVDAELMSGQLNPKTIYVFQKWVDNISQVDPKFDSKRDLFARINGEVVLAPNYKMCADCKQVDPFLEISSIIPTLNLNEVTNFSKGSLGADLLLKGWAQEESWGVWSSGSLSSLALPLGDANPSKVKFTFRGIVGPKHQSTSMELLINGEYQKTIQITKQLNNSMLLDIPVKFRRNTFLVIEFKYLNPTSPKNAGYGNEDDRLLTLGMESVQLIR